MREIKETPYDKGKTSFDISFNSGQISIGVNADNLEKYQKVKSCLFIAPYAGQQIRKPD